MARKSGLWGGSIGILRDLTGAGVIAVDNASFVDANYPIASAFDARGFDTVFVGVEIDAGTAPTATIEFLFRDGDAADGLRWQRLLIGARDGFTLATTLAGEDSGALASNAGFVEMHVYGQATIYARVKAVTNATSTTGMRILAMPGRPRNIANINR